MKLTLPEVQSQQDSNSADTEPWLMLLGENGVGKSSMLQAISLALIGQKSLDQLGIDPADILNRNAKKGFVKVYHYGDTKPYRIEFTKAKIKAYHDYAPANIIGYGSTRLAGSRHSSRSRKNSIIAKFSTEEARQRKKVGAGMVRIENLFFPDEPLINSQEWITGLKKAGKDAENKKLFDWLGLAIKDLLLLGNKGSMVVENDIVKIRHSPKNADSLEQLSDGYKSVIAVAVDLMRNLIREGTTMETAQGIVLIDEIGTHLHPRWKMQVVKQLRKVFPKLQFIVTTHDPLCLRGLKKGEVSVFSKGAQGKIHTLAELPDSSLLSAEQLLNSQFFGLNSTYDPDIEDDFNQYYYLLSRKKLSPKEKEKIKTLKDMVYAKRNVGSGSYEIMLNKVIDQELANSKYIQPIPEDQMLENIMKKVRQNNTKPYRK